MIEFFEKILNKNRYKFDEKIMRKDNNYESSVYKYDFLMSLSEKDYPKYLENSYFIHMRRKLHLKNPKLFTEKIQWLKLYDNSPIKTELTDKVLVRDYVKNLIGEQYLKPIYSICDSFDEINYDSLPQQFIIQCNHGCKWQMVIKDKDKFLSTKQVYDYVKNMFDNWLEQNFFGWSDFELQYKNIAPKLLVEEFFGGVTNKPPYEIEVWTINSQVRLIGIFDNIDNTFCLYDENLEMLDFGYSFSKSRDYKKIEITENIKQTIELSKKLVKDFKLARFDWLIYNDNVYFNEITFTPFSGFMHFYDNYKIWNEKLGKMLNLKGN